MLAHIKEWYEGKFIQCESNDPRIAVYGGHYERHWTSDGAHALVDFFIQEWRAALPIIITAIGCAFAVAAYFKC